MKCPSLPYHWAVVGAGPAGIAAVGKLIDYGIPPQAIAWLDPEFKVGDFGTKWKQVSSNTKVKLFTKFYESCQAFQYTSVNENFNITHADPEDTCLLDLAAAPLRWITDKLKNEVQAIQEKVQHLKLIDKSWRLTLDNEEIYAKNVILATGAEPKSLSFPNLQEIPLETALDPDKLMHTCHHEDCIAIFGSSHSAIIIIKTLIEECSIKKIINFYLEPLRYAVYFDDWILFDDTGLKGKTAEWARKNIDHIPSEKLERMISNEENIRLTLPSCNKVIYATGFQKRLVPVDGMQTLEYNDNNGIIAPGLFGLGIAFPEAKRDRYGTLEYRVGLWKFMEYLNQVMPIWLKYGI
ncbi:MAG: FAD-dependent oxidoreductase [Gammaproteobacteria bacterium]|nr:FAD-dependent oxidoreductase [Gammaproteobacteria bacterium]MCW5583131.1 FAD-dependent oxidoreductase [Gammaproteobacteria bacterium]